MINKPRVFLCRRLFLGGENYSNLIFTFFPSLSYSICMWLAILNENENDGNEVKFLISENKRVIRREILHFCWRSEWLIGSTWTLWQSIKRKSLWIPFLAMTSGNYTPFIKLNRWYFMKRIEAIKMKYVSLRSILLS